MDGSGGNAQGQGGLTPDPSQLRVSDADRHAVADLLREAAGEGRIDLDELDERLDAAYSAKTYADLVPITIDLPVAGTAPAPPTAAGPPVLRRQVLPATVTHESSVGIMSETKRRGAWLVPPRHTAVAFMGSVVLDMREATFAAREVTIQANAVMAGIDVIVDAYTQVVVDGMGIMGDFSQARDKVPAQLSRDSPVVRVTGFALMAGVTVTRKGPPGSGVSRFRKALGG